MRRLGPFLAALLVFVSVAGADELHLKDGTKIVGTIVGFEKNSFRVKTAYGFAVVQRSSVASITISKPVAESAAEKKEPAAKKPAPATAQHEDSGKQTGGAEVAELKATPPEKKTGPAEANATSFTNPMAPSSHSQAATNVAQARPPAEPTRQQNSAAPAAPAASAPSPATASPAADTTSEGVPVREEVRGNLYINDTYGFHIYKPPEWNVIEGARAALPGAIVAMGTSDQTTYLIIGLEPSGGTLQTHLASTNQRLANMFDGFSPSVTRQTAVAGLPAYEYQFQGAADDKQWAGVVVLISRGSDIFTIFGVTLDSSDLVQIQQNVIARTIASLEFNKP